MFGGDLTRHNGLGDLIFLEKPDHSSQLAHFQPGKVICDFWGRTAREELVGVLLFQNGGRLSLLEGYSVDGQIQADPPEFGFPTLESLRELSEGEPPATIPS